MQMKQVKRVLSFALVMMFAMMALTACGKSKDAKAIDCKEFIDVTIKGFEGSGSPSWTMNTQFAQDREYMDKMFPELTRAEAEEELKKIYKQLKIKAEPEKELKNGDTVTITVDGSESALLTSHGLALSNASFTVKVEGLVEGTAFDPFEGCSVTFTGVNGYGDYKLDKKNLSEMSSKYGSVEPDYDKSGKLSNGDTFKLKYVVTFESMLETDKVVTTAREKEFIVSGLDEVKSVDPFDYYELIFKGYDGQGTARLQAKRDVDMPATNFWYCDATVSPNENLKNGDKVTLKFDAGSYDLARYGIKLSTTEKEVTVSGLEEVESIDPFSDDIIVFMGKAPMIQVEINKDKLPEGTKSYFTYYVNGENRYNKMTFEEDEEVTFTVEVSEYLQKKGYTVKETEKKIKAHGEGAFITDSDEIMGLLDDPKEKLIPMVKALEGVYQGQWMGTLKEYEDMDLEKILIFTLKKDERTQLGNYNRPCFNKVMYVYRVKGEFDRNSETDHFIGYTFSDFEIDKDGKTSFKSDEGIEVARTMDRLLSVYKMSADYYDSTTPDGTVTNKGKTKINVLAFSDEFEKIVKRYGELNPEFAEKYDISCTTITSDATNYKKALDELLKSGDTPVIYTADSSFVMRYTQGEMASYAATYEELGIDVDSKIDKAQIAEYSVEVAKRDDDVVGLGYQSTGGAFIYYRPIAKVVFGTDDPDEIASEIGPGWEKFFLAAEKCKEKGYSIVSGEGDLWHVIEGSSDKSWLVNGKLYIDPKREAFLDYAKRLYDDGFSNGTQDWSAEWRKDMKQEGSKKVFGFFGPAWLINSVMYQECGRIVDEKTGEVLQNGTFGEWGICQAPVNFFWGGTWVMANKAVTKDADLKEGVRELIEFITLDTSDDGLQYLMANGKLFSDVSTKDCVASAAVLGRSNGEMEMLGGQDAFPVFVKASEDVTGDNLTEYDDRIDTLWRNAVSNYVVGNYTREQAIETFKENVKNELNISAY